MKHLAIGFGIAFATGITLFVIFSVTLIVLEHKELLSLAALLIPSPWVVGPLIAQALERDEGRKSVAAGRRKAVYDFRSFTIAWPLMLVYGTAALLGGANLGSFLVGFLGAGSQASLIPFLFVTYLVGGWIGTRCSQYGLGTLVLVVFCTVGLGGAAETFLFSDETYKQYTGVERMSSKVVLAAAIELPLLLVAGLVGYWRGYKNRLSIYLAYLLSVLPPDTRDSVVELAYEEAQKAVTRALPTAPATRPIAP
jgi:hypothetical protein